jgi:fumarate reductase flavoprotein subunit
MKSIKTDVVVVAAGTAGLAAAVTAGEFAKEVIVFEKSGITRGSANLTEGLFAVESRLQRLKQMGLTREEVLTITKSKQARKNIQE